MSSQKYTSADWERDHNKALSKGVGVNATIVASDATLAKRRADELRMIAEINKIRAHNNIKPLGEY
jgi:diphthamide synthase (EF-2-diphthine--ammonia ligase)